MRRIFVVIFLSLIFPAASCAQPTNGSLPDEMAPGVRVGATIFVKKLFAPVEGLGFVTDIRRGPLRSSGNTEIGIAGAYGARFFDDKGVLKATIDFANRRPGGAWVYAKIVRRTGANDLAFFRQSNGAATYDSLVDSRGVDIWRTPYSTLVSTFGDLKGDGVPEFVFASQDDAIEVRNLAGSVVWRRENVGWADSIHILAEKPPEILIATKGNLVGLNQSAESVFNRKPAIEGYFSSFSVTSWGQVCAMCLLVSQNDDFLLLAPDGESAIKELPAKYAQDLSATPVRFDGKTPFLAVRGILTYRGLRKAGYQAVGGALYIFDPNGNLLYHEISPERVEALGVIPTADGKAETLLVGGENKVWQYSPIGPLN